MPIPSADSPAKISAALGSMEHGSVVSEVAERLLSYFTSGEVAVETRLPAERTLAASLGVGRSAVGEALAALGILGMVVVKQGSGTYLRDGISELLPHALSCGLMLGEPRTRELIELRGDSKSRWRIGGIPGYRRLSRAHAHRTHRNGREFA